MWAVAKHLAAFSLLVGILSILAGHILGVQISNLIPKETSSEILYGQTVYPEVMLKLNLVFWGVFIGFLGLIWSYAVMSFSLDTKTLAFWVLGGLSISYIVFLSVLFFLHFIA